MKIQTLPWDSSPDSPCEQALAAYATWLNEWHASEGDLNGDGTPTQVTRDMYDEYDDAPCLLLEYRMIPDEAADLMLIIRCSPYHDEGGPTNLTAWFTYDPTLNRYILNDMVQEFDTLRQFILNEGCLTNLPTESS